MSVGVRENLAARFIDERSVLKVTLQEGIERCERAGSSDNGQCQNVKIVGLTVPGGLEAALFGLKPRRIGSSELAITFQHYEQVAHGGYQRKFLSKLSSRYESRIPLRSSQPRRNRSCLAEELLRHIGVNDQTHLDTEQTQFLFEEKFAVSGRRVGDAAVAIQF
jgi:hypothetical protein